MKPTNKKEIVKKTPSPITYRVCGFIMKLLGIFMFLVGLLLISIPSSAIPFIVFGIVFYLLGRKYKKLALATPVNEEIKQPLSETITPMTSSSSVVDKTKKAFKVITPPTEEHHIIAGTSYRQKEIHSLGYENTDYNMTKKEIIDCGMEDNKIYQIDFSPIEIQLDEEPDNQYDSNAIKVIIDNVHVGYIKKGSCSHIKKLIREDKINSIRAEIYGGKYKVVYSDYDNEKDKDVYTLERGEHNFVVSIYVALK